MLETFVREYAVPRILPTWNYVFRFWIFCQVVFEGITERGFQGDLAIDDFRIFDGSCYEAPHVVLPTTTDTGENLTSLLP